MSRAVRRARVRSTLGLPRPLQTVLPGRFNVPRMPRPDLGPKPHLGYTQSLIDRVAERRLDAAWLAARLNDATHADAMSSAAS